MPPEQAAVVIWIPLVSAVIGGVMTAGAAIVVQLLQQRSQGRRERWRIAFETSVEYHGQMLELAKHVTATKPDGPPVIVMPLNSMILAHVRFLEAVERGPVTTERFLQLSQELEDFDKALRAAGGPEVKL